MDILSDTLVTLPDTTTFLGSRYRLLLGDCIPTMRAMPESSVDSVVCDPPYGLEFCDNGWDGADGFRRSLNANDAGRDNVFGRSSRTSPQYRAGHLFQEFSLAWATEALRVLKPGGHLIAFSGSRTYHRLAVAVEDAGFEIRDQIVNFHASERGVEGFLDSLSEAQYAALSQLMDDQSPLGQLFWTYGQGFPKSRNVAKDLIKAGNEAASDYMAGWGTALKPAHEPIILARKPLDGTVAANVLAHRTGALNIGDCRVGDEAVPSNKLEQWSGFGQMERPAYTQTINTGRWPSNVVHDGSAEVLAGFPEAPGQLAPVKMGNDAKTGNVYRMMVRGNTPGVDRVSKAGGTAARFFYCAKANKTDRNEGLAPGENTHPTVKPTALMRYLCRLVTPPGGIVLDPFVGSGSTGKAAILEGFRFLGIDSEVKYLGIAARRLMHAVGIVEAELRERTMS